MKLELPSKFIYIISHYDWSIKSPKVKRSRNEMKRALIRFREHSLTNLLKEL